MRIVLTGGGTAGHIVPNFAVIEELRKSGNHDFLYIGSSSGIEKKMVEDFGIKYKGVACGKLRRYFSFQNFVDFFKVPVGIIQSCRALRKFKAEVVFSKGGFVGLPVVVAAWILRIPSVIHESDLVPGLANKISARFANKICVSFPETNKFFPKFANKIVLTGNPIRNFIGAGNVEKGLKLTGLNKDKPIVLFMGGSQGAKQINDLVRKTLPLLLKKFQIIHLCGKGNVDSSCVAGGYVQYEYLGGDLPDVFALCDVVVTRGGANSLSEFAFLKKKAVVIPLEIGASRGDQIQNADFFADKFGWAVLNGEIDGEKFVKSIVDMHSSSFNENEDFADGSKEIAKIILNPNK
jgi:UDP-N-acetylglucosamine--N-acetylmuramyl-(pentapeptide) pyrophosphoryl-undecaprenol N-acetylglucosamine transferase